MEEVPSSTEGSESCPKCKINWKFCSACGGLPYEQRIIPKTGEPCAKRFHISGRNCACEVEALMMEQADMPDSKSGAERREGSNPSEGMTRQQRQMAAAKKNKEDGIVQTRSDWSGVKGRSGAS